MFAVQSLDSDAPASVYASVYPLTMILRIICAQLLVFGLYMMA
jgi:putative transport protein